jgi:hypothetical protein
LSCALMLKTIVNDSATATGHAAEFGSHFPFLERGSSQRESPTKR